MSDTIDKINKILQDLYDCIIKEESSIMIDKLDNNGLLKYDFNKLDMINQLEIMKNHPKNAFIELNNIDGSINHLKYVITGSDIHGDILAFIRILKIYILTLKDEKDAALILTGDYIDRGANSMLCIYLLTRLYNANLRNVYFLRGNHESQPCLNIESKRRIDTDSNFSLINNLLEDAFKSLPVLIIANLYYRRCAFVHALLPLKLIQTILYNADYQSLKIDEYDLNTILWADIDPYYYKHAIECNDSRYRLGLIHALGSMLINNVDILVRGHQASMLSQSHKSILYNVEYLLKITDVISNSKTIEDYANNNYEITSLKSEIYVFNQEIANFNKSIERQYDLLNEFKKNILDELAENPEKYKKEIEGYEQGISDSINKRNDTQKKLEESTNNLNKIIHSNTTNKDNNYINFLHNIIISMNSNECFDSSGKLITKVSVDYDLEKQKAVNMEDKNDEEFIDKTLGIKLDDNEEASSSSHYLETTNHYIFTSHANRMYGGTCAQINSNCINELYINLSEYNDFIDCLKHS